MFSVVVTLGAGRAFFARFTDHLGYLGVRVWLPCQMFDVSRFFVQAAHRLARCEGDRGRQCGGCGSDVGIDDSVGCVWFDVIGDDMASSVVA